jgi:acetylornithine deacetylase/succinyl-diaminopimelate desuccinylase-like protein
MSPPEDAVLGRGILVPTDVITDPYPSISMIPGRLTVRFDRRTLIGETAESVLSSIQNHLAQAGIPEVEVVVTTSEVETYTRVVLAPARFLPAWGVHSDHMLVCAAEQAAQEAGIQPRKGRYGFCTNGSESAGVRGLPTIGFGPGREEDAHIIDESVAVPQLRSAASFYEALSIRMSG